MEKANPVGAAQAGARIPTGFGAHGSVVASGYVMEACGLVHGVELRVDEAQLG